MNFHSLCDLDTHMNLFHIKRFIDSSCQAASCWYMHVHVCVYVSMCICACMYVHVWYIYIYICLGLTLDPGLTLEFLPVKFGYIFEPAAAEPCERPYYMHISAVKQLHSFIHTCILQLPSSSHIICTSQLSNSFMLVYIHVLQLPSSSHIICTLQLSHSFMVVHTCTPAAQQLPYYMLTSAVKQLHACTYMYSSCPAAPILYAPFSLGIHPWGSAELQNILRVRWPWCWPMLGFVVHHSFSMVITASRFASGEPGPKFHDM
jgi:hypothetical protein